MKKLVLLLASAFLVLSLSGTGMAALIYGGSEYQVFSSPGISWDGAKTNVEGLASGWHLVTITSLSEQTFVADTLLAGYNTEGLYWAGASQSVNTPLPGMAEGWSWVTGETWSYTAWATAFATEPNDWGGANEIYLSLDGRFARDWTWNDGLSGDGVLGYIAERTASVPEPSALLLLGSGLIGLVGYGRRRFKK